MIYPVYECIYQPQLLCPCKKQHVVCAFGCVRVCYISTSDLIFYPMNIHQVRTDSSSQRADLYMCQIPGTRHVIRCVKFLHLQATDRKHASHSAQKLEDKEHQAPHSVHKQEANRIEKTSTNSSSSFSRSSSNAAKSIRT